MIRIEIDATGPAFRENERQELAWILHDLADRLLTGQQLPIRLTDFNSHTVGACETDDPSGISGPAGRETP